MLSTIKLAFKFLDINALTMLYKSFVLPILDYCCVAWCPFYVKDIDSLERVQRRFTRMLPVYRHLPYEERLQKYGITTLYARRFKFDLVCMYKIVHGLIDIPRDHLFTFDFVSRTRGHQFKVKSKCARLDIQKHWFSYRVIPFWNSLPGECAGAASLDEFKRRLTAHMQTLQIK